MASARAALALSVAAIACSSSPPPDAGCLSGADCEPGSICIDGRCEASVDAGRREPGDAGCACAAGEVCGLGRACAADCADPSSVRCGASDVCDHATGRCVAAGTSGILDGEPIACGTSTCLPGTECGVAGGCIAAPPCAAIRCTSDRSTCWGASCASRRPVASCAPAPLERMRQEDFLLGYGNGLTDLELDDACHAYGVTIVSGPDYLRELAPDGTLTITTGVTNLNMGEVAVLRPYDDEFGADPGELALTYTCCASCGCRGDDPQGVARLDRVTGMLPMAIIASPSTGSGPFGAEVMDSGPYGLTWGRDRTLYVGNVETNGDVVRVDLETGARLEIARTGARVYATASYDRGSLLVGVAGGAIERVATDGSGRQPFATLDTDPVSLVRDPFLARVYVSLADGRVIALDRDGAPVDELAPAGAPARIAYSPDGALYVLRTGFGTPITVDRIDLPSTR
jgi:hypothetical protein